MSREEAKKNLMSFGIAEPTDEQVTNYLNQIGGETKKYKDENLRLKDVESELETYKRKDKSDLENLQNDLQKALQDNADLRKQFMQQEQKANLAKLGVKEELIEKLIAGMNADFDFDSLGAFVTDAKQQAEKQKEAEIAQKNSHLGGGSDGGNGGEELGIGAMYAKNFTSMYDGGNE